MSAGGAEEALAAALIAAQDEAARCRTTMTGRHLAAALAAAGWAVVPVDTGLSPEMTVAVVKLALQHMDDEITENPAMLAARPR